MFCFNRQTLRGQNFLSGERNSISSFKHLTDGLQQPSFFSHGQNRKRVADAIDRLAPRDCKAHTLVKGQSSSVLLVAVNSANAILFNGMPYQSSANATPKVTWMEEQHFDFMILNPHEANRPVSAGNDQSHH